MAKETKFHNHSTKTSKNINANGNNTKNNTSFLSFLPEFQMFSDYNTFLEIKETKNNSPILIYDEEALKAHINATFSLANKAQDVDYTEKINAEAPAPEFPAAIPSAENPAEAPAETPAN